MIRVGGYSWVGWAFVVTACGSDPAAGPEGTTEGSSSGDPPVVEDSSSTGGPDDASATNATMTSASTNPMTSADESESEGEADTGEPPECAACSLSDATALDTHGGNVQLNPGRAAGETGDGRGVAATHLYEDATVDVTVFDPVAGTWDDPIALRTVGRWTAEEHTKIEVQPTTDGAIVFEDANGRLFAHRLAGDDWSSTELTSIPNSHYVHATALAPDGRIAVLVKSWESWDGPSALHLAYYDVEADGWAPDPEPFLDDPALALFRGELAFGEDGDVMLTFISQPFDANWPRTGELHHFDAQTQEWSQHYEYEGFIWWTSVRPISTGTFAFYPDISEVEGGSYFFTEAGGLGEQTDVPYPDDVVGTSFRRAWFEWETFDDPMAGTDTIRYQTYSRNDPEGEVDLLDVYDESAPVEHTNTQTVAQDGRAYVFWSQWSSPYTVHVAVHDDDDGWSTPTVLGSHFNQIGPSSLAVNDEGDAVVAWSPTCGGPCPDDPTVVAAYSADDHCWHEGVALDSGADAYALPFSVTRDFAVTTVGNGFQGRWLTCR